MGLTFVEGGDGYRILHCWCYLLLILKLSYKTNYFLKTLNICSILINYYSLSSRQGAHLLWSRTVNSGGVRKGKEHSIDLQLEHK